MKAGSYLSLARNYSFVVILLTFIGLGGTQTYIVNNQPVLAARQLFIRLVEQSVQWSEEVEENKKYELNIPGLDPMNYEVLSTGSGYSWSVDYEDGEGIQVAKSQHIRIYCGGPRPWTSQTIYVVVKTADNRPIKWKSSSILQDLRALQSKIVWRPAQIPINATPIQEADIIRKEIESNAFERRTSMPGIGLEFRNGVAPWFIALTVLGLLVQIRNQIRRTFLDPDLAIDEPWLILDGRRGLEKATAGAWALAIFIAPWIATGCLIAVATVDTSIEGWNPYHLFILPLLLVGGWSSLTTFGELLRLRRLRLEKLADIGKAMIRPTST